MILYNIFILKKMSFTKQHFIPKQNIVNIGGVMFREPGGVERSEQSV